MIITIDGYSCQGKSYVGRALAEEMGLEFLATGRLVRYVAFLFNSFRTAYPIQKFYCRKPLR